MSSWVEAPMAGDEGEASLSCLSAGPGRAENKHAGGGANLNLAWRDLEGQCPKSRIRPRGEPTIDGAASVLLYFLGPRSAQIAET